jgi:putative ABC transport system permease protein
MKPEYDVLVVGGGPGGALAARTAAEKGLRVGLVEKRSAIGVPVRCAEGVGRDLIEEFMEPDPSWISGIYDGAEQATDTSGLYFRYDYLNEGMGGRLGRVGWYTVRIADPARAAELSQRIDALFANSPAETKTNTEKAFAQSFANQVGNVAAIVRWVLTAVFLIMLVVTGNTMAQSVRERTSELAVLKAVGYSDGRILVLVLVESCAIAGLGGILGLGLAWAATAGGDPTKGLLPSFLIPPSSFIAGLALAATLGLVTGFFPALRAMRLRIVDALRRV